jgi:DNA-binding NarL/FixJ family response regulator
MGDDLALLEQPAASEQPTGLAQMPRAPSQKRRSLLTPGEKATIRELAARGKTSSEIAGKLDRPSETVRSALRRMRAASPTVAIPAESTSSPRAPGKPKRSKPSAPFTPADRLRVKNLIECGLTAAQIAMKVNRGFPQVSKLVREISEATKPTSVPVAISDSKTTCSAKTWAALAAAARRRNAEPAHLLVQLAEGVLKRGSVDAVINSDAELVDDLRTVQIVLSLEAAGRVNGVARDYRIKNVALAHGERAG